MLQPGLIMDRPLLISAVIEHAAAQFGDVEIVSRETHGPLFRYTYAQCAARARQLAHALQGLGLRAGDAVATLAWNNHRHLEAYYAVSGSGLVIHTCNPRLHPDQLIYIINHAEDRALFFDRTFAPLIERIAPCCPTIEAWIALSDPSNMPELAGVDNLLCYEDCIAPSFSMPPPAARRECCRYRPGTRSCRRCPCFTSMAGACPMPHPSRVRRRTGGQVVDPG